MLETAVSLKAVAGGFAELRENLILGLIASIALLLSVAVIGLRAPNYLRDKYLEDELQLAKRVQSNLRPKPHSISPYVEFAACVVAADHVGGDFFDVFEAESAKVAIVLGDVSGKGVPAAPLVSVLQGAIRSSTAPELVIYSDGLTEGTDKNEEEFGESRIEKILSENANEVPAALCGRIAERAAAFASAETPQDDRTLMVVKLSTPAHEGMAAVA